MPQEHPTDLKTLIEATQRPGLLVETESGLRLAVPLMRRWIQSQPTP